MPCEPHKLQRRVLTFCQVGQFGLKMENMKYDICLYKFVGLHIFCYAQINCTISLFLILFLIMSTKITWFSAFKSRFGFCAENCICCRSLDPVDDTAHPTIHPGYLLSWDLSQLPGTCACTDNVTSHCRVAAHSIGDNTNYLIIPA